MTKEISVWEAGIPKETIVKQLILTSEKGFTVEERYYPVKHGKLSVALPPKAGIVLKHKKKEKEKRGFLQFL